VRLIARRRAQSIRVVILHIHIDVYKTDTVPCGDSPLNLLDAPAEAVALQASAEDGEARHAGDAGEEALARGGRASAASNTTTLTTSAEAAAGGARGEAGGVEGLVPAAPTAPRRIVQHTSTLARAQPLCSARRRRPLGRSEGRERGASERRRIASHTARHAREPYRGARELSAAALAHRARVIPPHDVFVQRVAKGFRF